MNILFVSPYHNNSHFISVQINSFKKYLKNCSWKLLVLDDSLENSKNIITNELEDIKTECLKYEDYCIYHKVPQDIHTSQDGPYRHRAVLNYMIQTIPQVYKDEFEYMASFDADMCLVKEFDVEKELLNYDIIAPKRIQWLGQIQLCDNFPIFEYIWVHCCFFNLKTIENINEIKLNGIPNTSADTGSMIIEFLWNNPKYKIKYLNFLSGSEYISSLFNFEFFYNNTFIHFVTGSNWQIFNSNYNEKFTFYKQLIERGLSIEDENKIENENISKWYPQRELMKGRLVNKQDLLNYGLKIN